MKQRGPDDVKIKELLDRTGYKIELKVGVRKYCSKSDVDTPEPSTSHEVFVGDIPIDMFEDELIPPFERFGEIYNCRLMMNLESGGNKGNAFILYVEQAAAETAIKEMHDQEIRGKRIRCHRNRHLIISNTRIFVGNIPKQKGKDEIIEEFAKVTDGLTNCVIYADSSTKNRGFCFLDYDAHKNAWAAMRKLQNPRTQVWGETVMAKWANPMDEVDLEVMKSVKVLCVRNLSSDVTEEMLKEKFAEFGAVETLKKHRKEQRYFAFIHFENREDAIKAMEAMNEQIMGTDTIEVKLAKPQRGDAMKRNEDRWKRQHWTGMMRGGPPHMMGGEGPPRGALAFQGRVSTSSRTRHNSSSLPLRREILRHWRILWRRLL